MKPSRLVPIKTDAFTAESSCCGLTNHTTAYRGRRRAKAEVGHGIPEQNRRSDLDVRRHMRCAAVATLLLSAVALPSQAQPATIAIRGRVIADAGGDPVANARVAILSDALHAPVVLTDGDGQFVLMAPASATRLVVSKTGYAHQEVTRPAADQRIEIRLQRGAAVSGRIVDE